MGNQQTLTQLDVIDLGTVEESPAEIYGAGQDTGYIDRWTISFQ